MTHIDEAIERIDIAGLILNASEQNKMLIGENIAMGVGAELQLKLEKAIKQELEACEMRVREEERVAFSELVENVLPEDLALKISEYLKKSINEKEQG